LGVFDLVFDAVEPRLDTGTLMLYAIGPTPTVLIGHDVLQAARFIDGARA
jgi:hypothetical protein